jgi:thiol-disulfide isomerase/thioredoxin
MHEAKGEGRMCLATLSVPLEPITILLAAVFITAGVAKLLDPRGSREAAKAFGAPEQLARPVAVGLPVAEIVIAFLLLPTATRWYAAVAALVLLLTFCAAIARVMARGEAPDCHCFGQLHSSPTGWRALARAGLLAALAGVLVVAGRADPGPSVVSWMSGLDAMQWLVLGLAVVLLAFGAVGAYAVLHVLRSYGHVLVRLDAMEQRLRAAGFDFEEPDEVPELGLEPGTPAPAFSLESPDGGRVDLATLLEPARPLLLLFTSPTCGPCSLLMPTVAEWQREHANELTIALLSAGDADAVRAEASEHGLENVLLDTDLGTYEAYQANGTPSAVLIGDDGTVAQWLAAGSDWIETLVQQALSGMGRTPGLPVDTELPALSVRRLDESEVDLRDVVERESVLLFWNPSCGFCRSLHESVLAWEADPPEGAPALVVVSAGEAYSVAAENFASTVVLDPEWTVSGALGADGTPMALLVSASGRIASPITGGGPAVLELLGARELSPAG